MSNLSVKETQGVSAGNHTKNTTITSHYGSQ
jgi:hypothetical protein